MRAPDRLLMLLASSFWLMSFLWAGTTCAQFQDLPPKTKTRIEKYGAEADAITNECDKKVLEAGKKLVKKLSLQLKVLTRERRLPESTAVQQLRDQLANCTKGAMFESLLERNQVPPSASMHGQFGEFMEEAAQINRVAGKKLTKLRDDFLKDLERLPGKDSIPVKQFREQVISLVNPDSDGQLPELPEDAQDAERIRKRSQLEMQMRHEKNWKREVVILLGKLQPILDKALEKEKLGEANAIQALIQVLTNQPDPKSVAGFLRSKRAQLPAEATDLLETFVRWHEAEINARTDKLAALDQSAAPQILAGLKKTLRTSDSCTPAIQAQLVQYYDLLGKRPDWLISFQRHDPVPSGEGAKILEALDQEMASRLQAADQKDSEARQQLVDALSNLAFQGSAAKEWEHLQQVLTSDYAEGLRGVLLIEEPQSIDAAAKQRIMEYRREGLKQLRKLRQAHGLAKEKAKEKLGPVRNTLIDRDDFRELVTLDTAFVQRKHAFPPIWIPVVQHKMFANNFSNASWLALLDVSEKGYLMDFAIMGVAENWFPRDQLALSPSELQPNALLFREHNVAEIFASTQSPPPIDSKIRLKIGSTVQGYMVFKWNKITVEELSPFGVVTYLDDAHTRVRVYPRSAIALPE